MSRVALMACKAFLSGYPPSMQEMLFQLLPKAQQIEIAELPNPAALETKERLKWDLLNELHYSWLAPLLRNFAENDLRLFMAALSAEQKKGLEKVLGFGNHLPKLSPLAKSTFRKQLLQQVTQNQELIPMGCLPEHPLNHLLTLPHAKLEALVRYLGLHDLSFEMRQIIATAKLKEIFNALSKKEGEYLQTLLLHKEPLVFERLFLEKWDSSKEELTKLLLQRGAHRLKHALYFCTTSLNWYVTHRLDMHLAGLVLKHSEKPVHMRAETILQKQIDHIVKYLNEGEGS